MNETDRIRELTRHLLDRTKETDILREALERIKLGRGPHAGYTATYAELQDIARDALLRASLSEEDEYVYDDAKPLLRSGKGEEVMIKRTSGYMRIEPAAKPEGITTITEGPYIPSQTVPAPKPNHIPDATKMVAPKPEVRSCETCARGPEYCGETCCKYFTGRDTFPLWTPAASGEGVPHA